MAEKMLVTMALDERDALKLKIEKKINALNVVAVKRKKDPTVRDLDGNSIEPSKYIEMVKSEYQSVQDMISRYNRLCSAIIQSNAVTKVTIAGKEMTIAQAIALRQQLNHSDSFEYLMLSHIKNNIMSVTDDISRLERMTQQNQERHMNTLVGKDKNISEKDMNIITSLVEGEQPELIDPLNINALYQKMDEQYSDLARNINSAIKISNATTEIEF